MVLWTDEYREECVKASIPPHIQPVHNKTIVCVHNEDAHSKTIVCIHNKDAHNKTIVCIHNEDAHDSFVQECWRA